MESPTKSEKQTSSGQHTITIQGIEKGSDNLIMSDGGETDAEKSATIRWEVAEGSGVEEITEIKKKNKPTGDVFKERPFRETGKKWKAKIKDRFDENTTEEYDIKYRKTPGGAIFTYDPKISVNA